MAKSISELRAYRISRELTDGEAYSATQTGNVINIAADGKTGAWSFTNAALSGHEVVLQILLNGEAVYTSEPLAPGASIEEIELTRALEKGEYDAVAVAATYDADGNYASGTRTPITLKVE